MISAYTDSHLAMQLTYTLAESSVDVTGHSRNAGVTCNDDQRPAVAHEDLVTTLTLEHLLCQRVFHIFRFS